jgi:hypothetical protein
MPPTLVFADNFSSDNFSNWDVVGQPMSLATGIGFGPVYAAVFDDETNWDSYIQKILATSQGEIYIGFYLRGFNSPDAPSNYMSLYNGTQQLYNLGANASYPSPNFKLSSYFNNNPHSGNTIWNCLTNIYIEVHYKPSLGSDGIVEVRVNGTMEYSFTGQTCKSTQTPLVTSIIFGDNSYASGEFYAGDIKVTTGGWPSDLSQGPPPAIDLTLSGGTKTGGSFYTAYYGGASFDLSLSGGGKPGGISGLNFPSPPAAIKLSFKGSTKAGGKCFAGIPVPLAMTCVGGCRPGGSIPLVPAADLSLLSLSFQGGAKAGGNFKFKAGLPISGSLSLSGGCRASGSLNLDASLPLDQTVGGLQFPIASQAGGSLNLTTIAIAPVKVLNGVITMKAGGVCGLAFNLPPVTVVLVSGGTAAGGLLWPQAAVNIETWAVTGNNYNPSVYSNFPFNSYAKFRGKEYGAGENGIYLLSGADDDGKEIHDGIRIVTNFGTEKHKRLRSIHLGKCGDHAQIRAEGDSGEVYATPDEDDHRAVVSRSLQSKQFTLDIVDFEALSQVEITVLNLVKR